MNFWHLVTAEEIDVQLHLDTIHPLRWVRHAQKSLFLLSPQSVGFYASSSYFDSDF